jgi:hypothetical protein
MNRMMSVFHSRDWAWAASVLCGGAMVAAGYSLDLKQWYIALMGGATSFLVMLLMLRLARGRRAAGKPGESLCRHLSPPLECGECRAQGTGIHRRG